MNLVERIEKCVEKIKSSERMKQILNKMDHIFIPTSFYRIVKKKLAFDPEVDLNDIFTKNVIYTYAHLLEGYRIGLYGLYGFLFYELLS